MISGLKIAGMDKQSFIDYPGKIATLIFTQGCNFRCFYCHNKELVLPELFSRKLISTETVINYLKKNIGLLDALAITGGEPTLQQGIIPFIENIKELGFKVKLDTNGTDSRTLKYLIQNHLIDYIAMDIKTSVSLAAYKKIVGDVSQSDINNILHSIEILLQSNIQYEFRTTVVKNFHDKAIIEDIGRKIRGADLWFIQNCIFKNTLKPLPGFDTFDNSELETLVKHGNIFVRKAILRN